MSGKGSAPRPYSVDRNTFASNWDRIFGKKAQPITVTVPEPLQPDALKPNGAADASKAIRLVGSTPTGAAIYIDNATGAEVS